MMPILSGASGKGIGKHQPPNADASEHNGPRRGFTIIELAIVLTIVGILATMAVFTYKKVVNKARFTQARTALKHLQKTETIYFTEHDKYTDNVVLLDFNPVKYEYYDVSVTLLDNDLSYIGYATGVRAMDGDLWFITRDGEPTQDNTAKARF
jgi:prepilin-type N-terminal cleavage/methylation domain-containing protein